jgi:hypothetical protein
VSFDAKSSIVSAPTPPSIALPFDPFWMIQSSPSPPDRLERWEASSVSLPSSGYRVSVWPRT